MSFVRQSSRRGGLTLRHSTSLIGELSYCCSANRLNDLVAIFEYAWKFGWRWFGFPADPQN